MRSVEAVGRSVEEAIQKALAQLGAKREEVEVEILERPKLGGFLGEARVRVTLRETRVEEARRLLRAILDFMGIKGEIAIRDREDFVEIEVITTDGGALLIGKGGQTLTAIRHILYVVINKGREKFKRVFLDINGYVRRQEEKWRRRALTLADKVKRTKQPEVLESLTPAQRKIVHNALKDDPDVYTYSEGEEPNRRLIIAPKQPS